MESLSLANRLRSGKIVQEYGKSVIVKDSSKRLAEALPDPGANKKRILGDITNKSLVSKGKQEKASIPAKELKTKSSTSSNENETVVEVKAALPKNETSKCSRTSSKSSTASDDSAMYVTAMEMNDSAIDVSAIQDPIEEIKEARINGTLPDGVEDFDASCLEDPYSVPEYAAHIFIYYREREILFPISKYLDKQPEMTRSMRAILVDWMVEVQESFELNHETLYLAVKLVDLYLMHHFVAKSKLQLIGATSIFVASKFDERMPPLVDDFLYICDDSYTRSEFLETEVKILKTVNFDLGIPLSYRFLRRFARCSRISMELLTLARFILESALMDYELVEIVDSKLAAAALLLALKMKNLSWNATLEHYSEYKEGDLEDVSILLNANISSPPSKHLQTIRTKYSHPIFFEVAKVPVLKLSKNSSNQEKV